jgi:hypothetical protein
MDIMDKVKSPLARIGLGAAVLAIFVILIFATNTIYIFVGVVGIALVLWGIGEPILKKLGILKDTPAADDANSSHVPPETIKQVVNSPGITPETLVMMGFASNNEQAKKLIEQYRTSPAA